MGRCWSCLHGIVSNCVNNGTSCFGMITPIVQLFSFFLSFFLEGGGCNDVYKLHKYYVNNVFRNKDIAYFVQQQYVNNNTNNNCCPSWSIVKYHIYFM